jgi:glutathionyl-hydroquinone reductase
VAAVTPVFTTLDWLEEHLASRRFLVGDAPTDADWRSFTTLVRHYYMSHRHINPSGIVPVCPSVDFDAPVARSFGAR